MFDRYWLYEYLLVKINATLFILTLGAFYLAWRGESRKDKTPNLNKLLFMNLSGETLAFFVTAFLYGFKAPSAGFNLMYILWMDLFLYLPACVIASSAVFACKAKKKNNKIPHFLFLVSAVSISVFLIFVNLYAHYVEPFELKITRLTLQSALVKKPVTVLHLSDIQMDTMTKKETTLLRVLKSLQYDLMVITGDLINYKESLPHVNALLKEFPGNKPIFYVIGDTEYMVSNVYSYSSPIAIVKEEIQSTKINFLFNTTVRINLNGGTLCLTGVDREHPPTLKHVITPCPDPSYKILLSHSPDVILDEKSRDYDLVLAGHTHGGQVRLPFVGALVTLTRIPRKYSAGLFYFGKTILYVNRGVGLEGFLAPKIRLLCPPEIALLTVLPEI